MKDMFSFLLEFIVGAFFVLTATLSGVVISIILFGLVVGAFGWARSVWNEVRR